uniref:Proprotein convertase subtilisin/kexin type 9 n=1 Tax=Cynoglossus semilaevis TaxID=244447 RepID=A0A3P8V633_CYNSE
MVSLSPQEAWRMPGQYLVMLQQEAHESHVQKTIKRLKARATRRRLPLEVLQTYSGALHGFLVKMSSDVVHLALKLPHVHYIEEDSSIFAQSAPWNLQRLLQPHGSTSENGTYQPPNEGRTAEVFLMDGHVQDSHREIDGRVVITDFSNIPEEDGVRNHRQSSQCDSHGTHIAGVVSGLDSGVARDTSVKLVRVLNCQGKGTVSGALAGLEYIRTNKHAMNAVVVLLPFVGGFSRSLNTACRDMVSKGAVVIAAAGNYRDDACLYSPASEPEVITVGAINAEDQLMSQGAGGTNFGRCVDLFAPGNDIVSASSDCNTCFTTRSGTSQSAAHAAGVAAVILSSNQNLSPVQVLQMMLHYSISNTINLLPLSDTHRLTTPNLVAAMPPAISTSEELLCRSVWSERSGLAPSDRAISRCRQGEEMMGCKSFAPHGVHNGETIMMQDQQMECVAFNGPRGNGVFSVARCCAISIYFTYAPLSSVGCTSPSTAQVLSNSHLQVSDLRRCVGRDGVTSHAVCCHSPSLECHLVGSTSADKEYVEVSCLSGWTMTDCSAVSQAFGVLGAFALGEVCHVHGAAGSEVVTSLAVCCRVSSPSVEATA